MQEESVKLTCDHCRAVHIRTGNDHAEPWTVFEVDTCGDFTESPLFRMDLCPACAAEWKGVIRKFFVDRLVNDAL